MATTKGPAPRSRADASASDWDNRLASIRAWRCEAGIANAYADQIGSTARDVLAKGAPEWDHRAIVAIAMACHPAMLLHDAMQERHLGFESRFGTEDPRDMSPTGYRFLEIEGGRLQGGEARSKARWFEGPAARARFALLSAALVYFEAGMLNEAVATKDEARSGSQDTGWHASSGTSAGQPQKARSAPEPGAKTA